MNTITAEHQSIASSRSYGLSLLFVWALFWVSLLSSCVNFKGLRDFAAEKAVRVAECQAQDPASKEQARACLGQFARDLGTKSCRKGEYWLNSLEVAAPDLEGGRQ